MDEPQSDVLEEQEKALRKMEEETRQVFNAIGIDEVDLLGALRDKSRFTPEEWAALQRNREALEKAIDKRIENAKKAKKPTTTDPSRVQGHWIFVR